MRPWAELHRLVASGEDLEPLEHAAATLASMLGPARVPRSLARSRLHPAGVVLACAGVGSGPWTCGMLAAEVGVPAGCEVFAAAMLAAIDDRLLRSSQPALLSVRASSETRAEAVVHAGPRLLAALHEERETWAPMW